MLGSLFLTSCLMWGASLNNVDRNSTYFTNEEIAYITQNFQIGDSVTAYFYSLNDNNYGNAEEYTAITSSDINCFGYAINIDSWIDISFFQACTRADDAMYYNRIVPAVIQEAYDYGVNLRYLNGINESIRSNERRIAFRVSRDSSNTYYDFHFMKQHSDGSWSHKLGSYSSAQFNTAYTDTPEYNSAWYYFNSSFQIYYNTATVYFAVIS